MLPDSFTGRNLFYLFHFFPTQRFCGFQNGVGHVIGGEAVFESWAGHFAAAQSLDEIGDLMDERFRVADLQAV